MISKRHNKKGFTIVELIAGMLIGAILVISAGIMLYHGWVNWRKNSASMAMQQDALFAADIMERSVRPARYDNITVSSTQKTLTIGSDTSFYLRASASVSGKYDLVRNVSGNITTIIGGGKFLDNSITSLSFQKNTIPEYIVTSMTLRDGGHSITLLFNTKCRN